MRPRQPGFRGRHRNWWERMRGSAVQTLTQSRRAVGIIACAAALLLLLPAQASAQRGGRGGGHGIAGGRSFAAGRAAAPRAMPRAGAPAFSFSGRFSSGRRFGPVNNRFRSRFFGRRGYFVPVWWGNGLCYVDTIEPYDYSCYPYAYGAYDNSYDSYGSGDTQPGYSYQSQQPPVVIQLPPPPQQQAVASQPQAAPKDLESAPLLLVRRDGQVIEATGFMVTSDQVIYVTPQGLRRSFPVAELDKNATRDWNDARGTTVTLPG